MEILQKKDENVKKTTEPENISSVSPTITTSLFSPQTSRAKVLSNMIKQKRKEKAGKWAVPLPKVRPIAEQEMFRVVKTGKKKRKRKIIIIIIIISHKAEGMHER